MSKPLSSPHRALVAFCTLLITVLWAAGALAVPYHTPTIDGRITDDGIDWDPSDLVVDDGADDNTSRSGNVRNLWITWDQDNLYLAVTYQDFGPDESLVVYVDLNRGVGPNSAADLDAYPGNFALPDGDGIDLVLGRQPGDSADLGGPGPGVRLVTDGDGTTIDIADAVSSAQAFSVGKQAAALPFWFNAEFALPWSTIYPDGMPDYAVLKAVAVVTKSSAGLNGIDSAPDNTGLDGGTAQVTLANLSPSILDFTGEGTPDPATGSITGTVTLAADDDTTAVHAEAVIDGFAGRDPGAPLSVVTTAAGARDFVLPRLPDGAYTVSVSAEGYLPDSGAFTVSGGATTTGADFALEKAAAIRGTVTFASGPGGAGTLTLLDANGAEVQTKPLAAGGGPFVFYVEAGQYTVRAEAFTYRSAEYSTTVAAGSEVTGVDFSLLRKTEISGTVSFAEGDGHAGTVRISGDGAAEPASVDFPATGGDFAFFTDVSGDYVLSTSAIPTYVTTDLTVSVTDGVDVTGLQVVLPEAAIVSGSVEFEGPVSAGRLILTNLATVARPDTLDFASAGQAFSYYRQPGTYELTLVAPGYDVIDRTLDVGLDDLPLGGLVLQAVRADHMEIVDEQGLTRTDVRGTTSIFKDGQWEWFLTPVLLAARDAAGRDDLFDLDGNLTGFGLSALKMDDLSPARGGPVFFGSPDLGDTTTTVDFQDGRARFWMTNTAVEVLRVYLAQPGKEPLAGRIIVAFQDPKPKSVVLTSEEDVLLADGESVIVITAQLYDSAGNPSRLADVPVTFAVSPSSTGAGRFTVPTVTTNADGEAKAELSATGSGTVLITASVVIDNVSLTVLAHDLNSGKDLLPITTLAGPPASWEIVLPADLGSLTDPLQAAAQLVDVYGNPSPVAGESFTFAATPTGLGTFDPAVAISDTSGRAVSTFTPVGSAGLVTLGGQGGSLAVQPAGLRLRDVLVITDPDWRHEPGTRHVFPPTDLTALVVDNDPDKLIIDIPFTSNFDGLQMSVIFEVNNDAAGATADPFLQPVNYGQDLLPDYAIIRKFWENNYGDCRRWNNTSKVWETYHLDTESYTTGTLTDIQDAWTRRDADNYHLEVPWAAFGGRPDSLRIEAYLTQEYGGVKRSAFDSAPQDSTLNLTFDYLDPGPNDWVAAEGPVTLHAWGGPYTVKTDFPAAPLVSDVKVEPATLNAGEILKLTARVADGGDGVGDVLADLSGASGGSLVRMYDDGDANHGDQAAGDGVYSLQFLVPVSNPGGDQELHVSAFDGSNTSSATAVGTVKVIPIVEPIVQAEDPTGDDHGPNQKGTSNKYYTYPTNIVFGEGTFDLTGLTIYETTRPVGGQSIDMIAFQVSMVDFPDPADPNTADWNPQYADINTEKIDIMIDSGPGGATATLPNRQAAFQPWDAWDYAVIIDGWYKAVIPSLGQNTVQSWKDNARQTDQDIYLVSDPALNTVTALVAKSALGDPTVEDILGWDIAVCMMSHDSDGDFGGLRWVKEARSEWNFGGGQNSDHDSNIIDLLMIPGSGHSAGKSQEEMLDYESEAALARLGQGLTSVALEMTAPEDTGPPVIDTGAGNSILTRIDPLVGAPVAMSARISDDTRVNHANMRYRSSSYTGQGWDREVAMGSLGNDRWVSDILPSWLDSNLVYSPVDSNRFMEFEITAADDSGKVSLTPVTTLQISPAATSRYVDGDMSAGDVDLLQVDGSTLLVPDDLRGRLLERHFASAWTGGEVSADTMGSEVTLQWGIHAVPEILEGAPQTPPGQSLGIFRTMDLATVDSRGGRLDQGGQLPGTLQLSLHYPQAWLPRGADEEKIGIYEYNASNNRWLLLGGTVGAAGNLVTATVSHTGTYGLFLTEGLKRSSGDVISGILVSPNPFSPNGDGLYDEAHISFYLDREATVTVEIFNAQGDRKNVLQQTFHYAGDSQDNNIPHRVPGLVWDGRDFGGDIVPYGIYILRIETTYNQAGGTRTIRSNHSLAVIK